MNKYLTLIKILTLIGVSSSVAGALEKCQPIRLPNGRARIQRQGRLVRFRCLKGYEFVGRRYMNCFRGQWDFERDPSVNPPMCVKPGCRASSYVNGHFLETYKGAVVSVVCNLGYTLIGSSTVYCNGSEWNQPFPECRAVNPTPAKSCDFEDGLCGWTQEPHGDWHWHKEGETAEDSVSYGEWCNETATRTRPPYGCGNLGGYMFLGNSSSRFANATERLFSPVFPAEYSNNSCFAFWFAMNGPTAGYLKVFVKPEGAELYNTIPPFWVSGPQGYSWIPGYFPLYSSPAPFQVVIEGMSLPGNESETAFDDVHIMSGEECASFRETYLAHLPSTSATVETTDSDYGNTCGTCCGTTAPDSSDNCECQDSCLRGGIRCSRYDMFCDGDGTASSSTIEGRTAPIASATTDASTASATATKNSLETTVLANNVSETPRALDADTFRNRSEAGFGNRRFTAVSDGEMRGESEKAPATNSVAVATSSTAITKRPNKSGTAPRRRTEHNNFPPQIDPSLSSKILLDGRMVEGRHHHHTGGDSPASIKSEGEDSGRGTSRNIPPGAVEAAVAVAAVAACGIAVAAFIRRRRRKRTKKESLVEDSDVRFLTSDEFLDFTLARPADDDL